MPWETTTTTTDRQDSSAIECTGYPTFFLRNVGPEEKQFGGGRQDQWRSARWVQRPRASAGAAHAQRADIETSLEMDLRIKATSGLSLRCLLATGPEVLLSSVCAPFMA